MRRTYFDAIFCGDGFDRRLLVVDEDTARAVATDQVPGWDAAMVIVNSTVYGGSGGRIAVLWTRRPSTSPCTSSATAPSSWRTSTTPSPAAAGGRRRLRRSQVRRAARANVTVNTDRATLKWRQPVAPTTPLPTSRNANCRQCDLQPNPQPPGTVGLDEGAGGYHCGAYRPEFDCKMRTLPAPYCAVCRRRIRQKLTPCCRRSRRWPRPPGRHAGWTCSSAAPARPSTPSGSTAAPVVRRQRLGAVPGRRLAAPGRQRRVLRGP